jgi:hypothetical protein
MLEPEKNILSIIRPFKEAYLYCVDPGAYNVMLPLSHAMENNGMNSTWVVDGWCIKNVHASSIEWNDFMSNYSSSEKRNSCMVLGSQTNFNQTQSAVEFCRDNGIYSLFLFDHWVNYVLHFWDSDNGKLYLPDKICIMDDVARDSLIRELSPLLPDREFINNIEVVGHPSIEKSVLSVQGIPDERLTDLRKSMNAHEKKVILFLLEPIEDDFGFDSQGKPSLGYTEYTISKYFFDNVQDRENTKILIKPHPRQDQDKIRDFLSRNVTDSGFDVDLIERGDLESLIAVADEVVGITTVALITALKTGKKITSIQVGRNEHGCRLSNEYLERNLVL